MDKYGEGKGTNDIPTDDTKNIYIVAYSRAAHPNKAGLIYVKII
jgi:hypothetical protein